MPPENYLGHDPLFPEAASFNKSQQRRMCLLQREPLRPLYRHSPSPHNLNSWRQQDPPPHPLLLLSPLLLLLLLLLLRVQQPSSLNQQHHSAANTSRLTANKEQPPQFFFISNFIDPRIPSHTFPCCTDIAVRKTCHCLRPCQSASLIAVPAVPSAVPG